jgi:phosphatidylethanolamine-binding protein (PEBP) family uncharacterized protein
MQHPHHFKHNKDLKELHMSARVLFVLACVMLVFALTAGCAKKPEAGLPKLQVLALAVEHCSKNSPEFRIGNVPAGTASFEVHLRDLHATADQHGGGTYRNDGTGVIPEGALRNRYVGPCSRESLHRYEFTVIARDAAGKALADGIYAFNF